MLIIVNQKEYESGFITEKKYDMLDENMASINMDNRTRATFSKAERQLMKESIIAYFDNKFTEEELMKDRGVDDLVYLFFKLSADIMEKMDAKMEKYKKNFQEGK